jgi:hypothetical protein
MAGLAFGNARSDREMVEEVHGKEQRKTALSSVFQMWYLWITFPCPFHK